MKKRTFLRMTASEWLWLGVLVIVLALNGRMLWITAHHLIDSDSASELVLAQHLNEAGRILSTDWYYSTELRVLNTQLVFAPLFSLFSDWQLVRFVGAALLEVLLLASYGFLVRQSMMDKKVFFIGGSLLLSPMSVKYCEVVLAHSYYIPHIAISFLMAGLLMGAMRNLQKHKNGWTIWYACWLMVIAFVSALGGFRQVAATHVPLVLLATIWMHRAYHVESAKEAIWSMLLSGSALLAGLCGLLCNDRLHKVFAFLDHSDVKMSFISADKFIYMIEEFLQLFGFQEYTDLVSITGILSVATVIVSLYCTLHTTRSLLYHQDVRTAGNRLFESMFACSMAVVVLIYSLTKFNYSANLYFIPFFIWYAPLLSTMAVLPSAVKEQEAKTGYLMPSWYTLRRMIAYAMCGVCLLNGFVNLRAFSNPSVYDESFTMEDPVKLQAMSDFLVEEGYDLGYTTFWNGNALTEMSDGAIKIVNLQKTEEHEDWTYFNWLTLASTRSLNAEKPFMMLKLDEKQLLNDSHLMSFVQRIYEADGYAVYEICDLESFRNLIMTDEINGILY